MKFKGTIVITDPCYIMRAEHHCTTPTTEDDWEVCSYGGNMEALGINHYITESTIYGDWSCTTYAIENPQEAVDKLAEISKYFSDKYEEYGGYKGISEEQYKLLCKECDGKQDALNLKVENIGHFCADAGLVGVFLLDEVMKYNPKYKDITDAAHCVTLIKDFHGEISINIIHDDEYDEDEVRVVGTGNINFETRQTGL